MTDSQMIALFWERNEDAIRETDAVYFAYLAKICRNSALGRLQWLNAAKRSAEIVELTREELAEILNRFLEGLPKDSRLIFLRRYWYTDSVAEIASRYRISQSKVKTQLHRTRNKLRMFLEKEGIAV